MTSRIVFISSIDVYPQCTSSSPSCWVYEENSQLNRSQRLLHSRPGPHLIVFVNDSMFPTDFYLKVINMSVSFCFFLCNLYETHTNQYHKNACLLLLLQLVKTMRFSGFLNPSFCDILIII